MPALPDGDDARRTRSAELARTMPLSDTTRPFGAEQMPVSAISATIRSGHLALGTKLRASGLDSGYADGVRFEVKEMLGAGANGHVFDVRDHNLERDVAMKVLSDASERPL